jgi:hypothetical protein
MLLIILNVLAWYFKLMELIPWAGVYRTRKVAQYLIFVEKERLTNDPFA